VFVHAITSRVSTFAATAANIQAFLQVTHAVGAIINGLLDISVGYRVANADIHGKFYYLIILICNE